MINIKKGLYVRNSGLSIIHVYRVKNDKCRLEKKLSFFREPQRFIAPIEFIKKNYQYLGEV